MRIQIDIERHPFQQIFRRCHKGGAFFWRCHREAVEQAMREACESKGEVIDLINIAIEFFASFALPGDLSYFSGTFNDSRRQ